MAFGAQNLKQKINKDNKQIPNKQLDELNVYIEGMTEKFNLIPLMKNVEKIKEINFKSYSDAENAKMEARNKAGKIMNVVRYMAPLIKLACDKSNSDEGRAKILGETNALISEHSKKLMVLWNISPEDPSNNWILNVLNRTIANSFNEKMLTSNDEEIEKIGMQIYNVANMSLEEKYDISYFSPMTTSVKLAIMKGAIPVYNSIYNFAFGKDKNEMSDKLTKFIVNKSTEAIEKLADPMTEEKDRIMMFKVFIEEAGNIVADIWDKQAVLFKAKYANASEVELQTLKRNGIPIENEVIKRFDERFNAIINIIKISI